MNSVSVLKLILHHVVIGYLAGFQNGKNILVFTDAFRLDSQRPTLSILTSPVHPQSEKILEKTFVTHQRLHPLLSNLLPEGALRELIASSLKFHIDNEFQLLVALGHDLPGALLATQANLDEIPDAIKYKLQISNTDQVTPQELQTDNKFSLAGVQMKFSMKAQDGRFTLAHGAESALLGDWIIKTPSTRHAFVPLNEYSIMMLAEMAGIEIPEIQLVDMACLQDLPVLNFPQEQYAFAIKRFDRYSIDQTTERIHIEDFAQIFGAYPHQKYSTTNYEQIGQIIYQYSGNKILDIQQFASRILINILLANGDAHLKNWSMIYPDTRTPRFSPAYDILMTSVYIENERHFALNLAKNKDWYLAEIKHFRQWAEKVGVPWRVIEKQLHDVMAKARALWPKALADLPMATVHKEKLKMHWQQLHPNFRILAS
ncbi:type II toxin-antitoxin system HipA family toxin [Acinetobacter sp. ANC 3791]|uniref:type II toxin-antitoxin system HipA family toxin n=1 Tax=Acinetobacter sp. ANC 3791 TaxID=2529836 RepID=UPI0010404B1E|nr:type II toxin-antitoxin system HipA family toxin [Acinetobacter sp. ANC 3791]TCB82806.1 type II toxin-antitoxin system HipA family toxin [Acinetobacter sp. ANC 3791]